MTTATVPAAGEAVGKPETPANPTLGDTIKEIAQQPDPALEQPNEAPDKAGEPEAEKPGEDEKDKAKNRVPAEQRIKQAVSRQRLAERERDRALSKLAQYERPLAAPKDRELDYDEREDLRLRNSMRTAKAEDARDDAIEAQQEARFARNEAFIAACEGASERMPTLLEDFAKVPVTEIMAQFIADSSLAPEVAFYLSRNENRDECLDIIELTDPRNRPTLNDINKAARLMANIEGRLTRAPQVRRATNAPAPGTALGGGAPPAEKSLSEMASSASLDEFAPALLKKLAAKR